MMIRISLIVLILNVGANAQIISPPTLDELLHLKWKVPGTSNSANPLVNDGLVFETFGLEYGLDALTGEKLYFGREGDEIRIRMLTRDSILLFTSKKGIALLNIYTGLRIYESKQRIRYPRIRRPRIITGDYAYTAINDSSFAAINISDASIKWQTPLNDIYNEPIISEELLIIGDQRGLHFLNKEEGNILKSLEVGQLGSKPHLVEGTIYVWIEKRGLIAYDLTQSKIIWEFSQNRKGYEKEIVPTSENIYFNSFDLYSLSQSDGNVIWRQNQLKSFESFILFCTDKYVLTMKGIDDFSVLVACDIANGNIVYQAFKNIYGSDNSSKPLAYLEGENFRFGTKMHNSLLYAVDLQGNMYCFEVNE